MQIVTIDCETFYDKDYSLSKLSTEEYVRDPRFEVIGVSLKVQGAPTAWYSGDDPGGFLRGIDYSDKAILCHNTAFDGAILGWRFGIRPKLWLDTLSMARPKNSTTVGLSLKALANYYDVGVKGDEVIHALGKRRADFTPDELRRYGDYCVNDTDMTYKLFKKIKDQVPPSELMVIDQTLRMFIEPQIELDTLALEHHLVDVRLKKEKLLEACAKALDEPSVESLKKSLASNPKFAELLKKLGVPPPQKISKTTGQITWAFAKTDEGIKALESHPNPAVQAVVSARLGTKSTLEETRTESLIEIGKRGNLPVMLNYWGAHTGRFSGSGGINLQNITRGSPIRRAMCATNGKVIVASDSSQIEARVLALIAGQWDLVEAFREKRDIYSEFATDVYGYPVTKADKKERFVGKTSVLGLGYGMGADKFQTTLAIGNGGISVRISLPEAQLIVQKYRNKYPHIARLWKDVGNALHAMANGGEGTITTLNLRYKGEEIFLPNGMSIRYPHLQQTKDGFRYISNHKVLAEALRRRITGASLDDLKWTYLYGAKVVENITQALARIVISEQMTAITPHYPVVLQVHDELVVLADEQEAQTAKAFVATAMSTPPKWAPRLPVACDAGFGRTYGDIEK